MFNFSNYIMQVLILGGLGDMGSNIVKSLNSSLFEEIHIGDINKEKGEVFVSSLGEKYKFVFLDVRYREKLVEILKKYDIVVNAIGPFYEFGAKIADTAIEAGVDFLDICDDYEPTKQILEMDEKARSKGVTVITGIGWTPGLSNLLAKYAYEKLGNAKKIKIYWVGSAADSKGLAVIMHLLYAITGDVPMYIEGKEVMVKAGSGREEVLYPEPIGKAYSYYTGHPEPVTIPRYLKGLDTVEVKGGLIPDWQNSLGKFFVAIHLTNTASRRRRLSKFIHKIEDVFRSGGIERSAVRVDVYSDSESLILASIDRMGRLTGIPAAICAELIAKGEISSTGCFAPEAVIEPVKFLKILNQRNVRILELKENKWNELNLE